MIERGLVAVVAKLANFNMWLFSSGGSEAVSILFGDKRGLGCKGYKI